MEIVLCVHVVRRITSNISGRTGPIFAIFSPYESALRADDGSLPYFPISQGRCHGNQIICERQVQHGQKTGVFCQITGIFC